MFADESSLMATTRLCAEGPSAKGLGPKLRNGAVQRPLALGAWPSQGNARAYQQSAERSSV